MVSPIYTIAIPLGAAFLLPLFEKVGKNAAKALVLAILGALTALPISWLVVWVVNAPDLAGLLQMSSLVVDTGGFSAPISIRLAAGFGEALVLALVNFTALLGIIHMLARTQAKPTGKTLVLLLTLVTGVNGLILTRDLFNIFVFLEITSISTYALIASNGSRRAYEAGFKYIIAGSIASSIYLVGVIYLYRLTGSLSLDHLPRTGWSLRCCWNSSRFPPTGGASMSIKQPIQASRPW
jgi:formate hydrogenlyase subunit 3/multisubunit Na+/H+ antiporter MnhD subunit